MKNKIFPLICLFMILLAGLACNAGTTIAPAPTTPPSAPPSTIEPTSPASETNSNSQKSTPGCEEYFQFCMTSAIKGAITASATSGVGSSFNNNCTIWAAGGDPRILELPFMLAAGENKITVALTRIGAYTGSGSYELKAVSTSGLTDSFPTIEVDGRTFSNGEGSTAIVTVAADGSGSIQAIGLVELASLQVSNPDPSARIDFSMQWTCQEEK